VDAKPHPGRRASNQGLSALHRDPEILPKITQLSDQHGIDAATVIALLAMNALATADFNGLTFWAKAAEPATVEHAN
jgi:hypothetical protein